MDWRYPDKDCSDGNINRSDLLDVSKMESYFHWEIPELCFMFSYKWTVLGAINVQSISAVFTQRMIIILHKLLLVFSILNKVALFL